MRGEMQARGTAFPPSHSTTNVQFPPSHSPNKYSSTISAPKKLRRVQDDKSGLPCGFLYMILYIRNLVRYSYNLQIK